MQSNLAVMTSILLAFASQEVFARPVPEIIPSGTDILVRVNETIDSRKADEGRIYDATVDQDILDKRGGVAVPRGARAELLVREVKPGKDLVLDLQSLTIDGRRRVERITELRSLHKRG